MTARILVISVLVLGLSAPMAIAQATNPGPSSAEPGSSAGPNGTMNDTAAFHQSSRTVQAQIQHELRKNNLNGVTTNVNNDSINLGGTVATQSERDNDVQIARSIGQKNRKVVDQITVPGSSR